ncbi:MAG: hypothetical protein JNK95_04210 [Candidatus Competibacter sp.]|nr:hypothetical protein [Candidatus Competibacter sp.]
MTPPAALELIVYQGATWSRTLIWKAGAPAIPVDLTGCGARMQARTRADAPDPPLLSLTTENGGITLGGGSGAVELALSAVATAALSAGSFVYDLEIVHPDSTVTRLAMGKIKIIPEVTR